VLLTFVDALFVIKAKTRAGAIERLLEGLRLERGTAAEAIQRAIREGALGLKCL